jgi:hypothetical protein
MKISQAQLREAAQILYPKEWRENPGGALVEALKYLREAVNEVRPSEVPRYQLRTNPVLPRSKKNDERIGPRPKEISELEAHLKQNEIHVSAAARALEINAVTLYAWFHGKSRPKPENLAKIRNFLTKTKA